MAFRNTGLVSVKKFDDDIRELDLGYNNIVTLEPDLKDRILNEVKSLFPKALTKLIVCRNRLTELDVSMCSHLVYLDCSYNDLESFPLIGKYNDTLVHLNCSHNRISNRFFGDFVYPDTLSYLNVSFNKLDRIVLGEKSMLKILLCTNLNLTELIIPAKAWRVECDYNKLKILIIRFSKLLVLKCSHNRLTEIYANPELKELHCADNWITKLINIEMLMVLDASHNRLSEVATNASKINLRGNLFSTIPYIGIDVVELDLSENGLVKMDTSPYPHLEILWCSDNRISRIISNAKVIDVHGNRLGSRFKLNYSKVAGERMFGIDLDDGEASDDDDYFGALDTIEGTGGRCILPQVKILNISSNGLIELRIPDTLEHLDCSQNELVAVSFKTQPLYKAVQSKSKYQIPHVSNSCPESLHQLEAEEARHPLGRAGALVQQDFAAAAHNQQRRLDAHRVRRAQFDGELRLGAGLPRLADRRQRTPRAPRIPGQANRGAQLHERLVERARARRAEPALRHPAESRAGARRGDIGGIVLHPRHHSQHVAIHHRVRQSEGHAGDGRGGVVSHSRKRADGVVLAREPSRRHHRLRRPLHVARPLSSIPGRSTGPADRFRAPRPGLPRWETAAGISGSTEWRSARGSVAA